MSKDHGGPAFPRPVSRDDRTETFAWEQEGMTLRQYAAIKLRVPNSGTEWLDEMILQSLHDELAGKTMQAICPEADVMHLDRVVLLAHRLADEMLKEREK